MMQDVQVKLNPGLQWQKQHSTRRRFFFASKLDLKFMEEGSEILYLEPIFMVLKLGHIGK
jgi:hypothetical protein